MTAAGAIPWPPWCTIPGAVGQNRHTISSTMDLCCYKDDAYNELIGDINIGGGQVTSNNKEADLVVVGTDPKEKESEYLKDTSIPQIQLELLYKVIDEEVPLSNIIGTPSKVSFAPSTTDNQRGDRTSSTRGSKYGFPRRIPVPPPQPPSISSPSWTSQSATSQGGSGKGLEIGGGAGTSSLNPKYTILLNVRVTFSQAENPAEIAQLTISGLLTTFKGVDRHFVLRHLDKDNVGISRAEDVPIIKMLYESYAHFNGATKGELQPFPNPNQDRKRSISFTIRVGTSITMSKVLGPRRDNLGVKQCGSWGQYKRRDKGLTRDKNGNGIHHYSIADILLTYRPNQRYDKFPTARHKLS